VDLDSPQRSAIDMRDQCVALAGADSSVATTTSSTCSAVTDTGRPGRGSSTNPSQRPSTNRRRHLPTVGCATRSRAATSLFDRPSAQPSTIREPQRQRLRGRPPLRRDHCDERPRQPAGHRVSPPRLGVHRRAQQADGASVGEPRAGPRPVDADVSRRAESDSSRPRLAPNCSRPTAECPTISPPSRCKAPLRSPQYEAEGAPRPEPTTTRGT